MGTFYNGYENISVSLKGWTGDNLAKEVCGFGGLAEFYEGAENTEYDFNNPHYQKVVDEIISGKTFGKYEIGRAHV